MRVEWIDSGGCILKHIHKNKGLSGMSLPGVYWCSLPLFWTEIPLSTVT